MSIKYERLIMVLVKVKNIIDNSTTDITYSRYNSVNDRWSDNYLDLADLVDKLT